MTAIAPLGLLIIGLIIFVLLKNRKRKRSYLSNRTVLWLLGGYITILVVCGIVSGFMPQGTEFPMGKSSVKDNSFYNIYALANEGKINEVHPSFIQDKWEKNYTSMQLHVELQGADFANTTIFVQDKKVNDHKIEGTLYQGSAVVGNLDVSRLVSPLRVAWSDHTLILIPVKKNITLRLFKKDFPVIQFTKSGGIAADQTSSFGQQILYLRVPKGLKILPDKKLDVVHLKE